MPNDIEKALSTVLENYSTINEVHEVAYRLNPEYEVFWDGLPQDTKDKVIKARKLKSISRGASKFQLGLFHAATFGLSLGVKKLSQIGKPSREDLIIAAVTDSDFTELMQALNNAFHINRSTVSKAVEIE